MSSRTTAAPAAAAAVRVTTTETTVRTDDGAELAVTVLGPLTAPSGVTVVLSHGWAARRRVWGTVADRLIRVGHRVVLYDQRGHGASGLGREPISIGRLGADFAAVLNEADVGKVGSTLAVGHSGGGFAVLAYAAADPRDAAVRLRGLVLLGTAAHDQDTPDSEVRMMGSTLFSRALSQPALGRRLLRRTMGKRPDPASMEVNRQMFAATSPRVRADCFLSSRGMDLRAELAMVEVPAVVLTGDRDRVILPDLGGTVAEALPNARFERLPGTGHMLPLEAPDAVVLAVAELAERPHR
ncbi:alpha/beta fold hydrolase [Streptomyces sp. H27-D2]|uniref:alpha/beta fold hydrolase n=1 Tax=Streptomyces sp. H27-D2 TaxID=3046304 RepID=UPI002DBED597|nr:alpha/beta hydrolase [Streptomyces sp. H27-D2]MEC4019681.1 alpha/beta hydrolase [Streptomyces sp. H27-D2]